MPETEEKEEKKPTKKSYEFYLKNIQQIKDEMKVLNGDRETALQYYNGDPEIVKFIQGRSKLTTTDLMDVVEWIKPSLLEIFAGGDEVATLEPGGEDDVDAVEKQQLLVNHQLRVKNQWFLTLNDWFEDALLMKTGALKYQWYTQKKVIEKSYDGLTDEEYQAKIAEEGVEVIAETSTVINKEEVDNGLLTGQIVIPQKTHDITIKKTVEDEYPLIEACPAEDVGFSPTARDITTVPFMYHRSRYPKWKIAKEFGKQYADALEGMGDRLRGSDDQVTKARFEDLGGDAFIKDEKKDEWYVYECYFFDPDDEGAPKIGYVCGDQVMKEIPNKYEKPTFRIITPSKMAHRIAGKSMFDLIKEIQKMRTALLRQVFDNLYFSNNRRYFGDVERLNVNDYLNNNTPGALIRTVGDPTGVVLPEEKAPLPPEVFQFWEMLNVEKDYHSGVPRSFQGVNPNILNKTWRGQNQQVSQAGQRIAMMARLIAEMGIAPLVMDVVELNIRFLKKKTSVRYLNKWVDINPDNIVGKQDVVVNVGIGTGDKDQKILYMQQLLGIYAQVKKAGIPVVTSANVYNAVKELVKAMGYKNVADFVTDPKFTEAVTMLLSVLANKGIIGMDPEITQLAQQVAGQLGLLQPEAGKEPNEGTEGGSDIAEGGTFPGQKPPAGPMTPHQPMNPVLPSQGGLIG